MSMVLAITGGAVVAVGFIARKSWLALHRMAGITPGTLRYVEQDAVPKLPLTSLTKSQHNNSDFSSYLHYLPDSLIAQLNRIDAKATICFEGIVAQQSTLTHPTRPISEDEFVAHKMTHERLPQMLIDYEQVMRFGRRDTPFTQNANSTPEQQATFLLAEFLDQLEARLDMLRETTQRQHLQALKGMARYAKGRK